MKVRFHIDALHALLAAILAVILCGCGGKDPDVEKNGPRHVLILYSAGYNSLSSYLKEDISDLCEGYLPRKGKKNDVVLVYSKLPVKNGNYTTPTASSLVQIYAGKKGAVRDTVKTWPKNAIASSAATLNEVLTFVKDNFPAAGYGMIFSSHASGWLPPVYYVDPDQFEKSKSAASPSSVREYFPPLDSDPSSPAVKSLGQDLVGSSDNYVEMSISEFAAAIPMHLDYLLFDACLTGCVEVAWELREKVSFLGLSPTEVLAEGYDYKTVTTRLLRDEEPDPKAVCQDYFAQYEKETGVYRSATITFVDTKGLEALAGVCSYLNSKYCDAITSMSASGIQGYFRYNRHFFYDLLDIYDHAGITPEERADLVSALDGCLPYKAATDKFISFPINTYSGLSMYLPSNGTSFIDNYYKKEISWNDEVKLVR